MSNICFTFLDINVPFSRDLDFYSKDTTKNIINDINLNRASKIRRSVLKYCLVLNKE